MLMAAKSVENGKIAKSLQEYGATESIFGYLTKVSYWLKPLDHWYQVEHNTGNKCKLVL